MKWKHEEYPSKEFGTITVYAWQDTSNKTPFQYVEFRIYRTERMFYMQISLIDRDGTTTTQRSDRAEWDERVWMKKASRVYTLLLKGIADIPGFHPVERNPFGRYVPLSRLAHA